MRVTLITPTADQPLGMLLCERYMQRQSATWHQWIVADDGCEHARLTLGQQHIRRVREHEGGRSLAGNLLAALPHVTGDVVLVIEHDDWYAPNHVEVCIEKLAKSAAAGSRWQRYYNVERRCWRVMRNVGSALCNTAFSVDLVPAMERAARRAHAAGSYGVDRMFWDAIGTAGAVHDVDTVVGIKGLPGRRGLGMGHRPDEQWKSDPELRQLRAWIGSDLEEYR
jgi:hypothetical protein